ncbi:hypothetical protein E3P91_03098 [Wallemia ichthyophaga]|nr:hypothetical protein E3P91_03098 [Wallemia ichthyophaga]TIB60810.1 hypothetical protein E3P78_03038 [Wallemia ichthyophaga]
MKFMIFASVAAILGSTIATPVTRDGQAVPDLLAALRLTQDQKAAVPGLLKNLGLAPTENVEAAFTVPEAPAGF